MSWFQSTNFASLAKSALKEAQKTIDRALELKEEIEEELSKEEDEADEIPGAEVIRGFDDVTASHILSVPASDTTDTFTDARGENCETGVPGCDDNTTIANSWGSSNPEESEPEQYEVESVNDADTGQLSSCALPALAADVVTNSDEITSENNQLQLEILSDEVIQASRESTTESNNFSSDNAFLPTLTKDIQNDSSEVPVSADIVTYTFTEPVQPERRSENLTSLTSDLKLEQCSLSSSEIDAIPEDVCNGLVRKLVFQDISTQTEAETQTRIPLNEPPKSSKDVNSKQIAALEAKLVSKESDVEQLRNEGEKLSKKQLELSNIIKKLRAREKEKDDMIKNLKTDLSNKCTELERLMSAFVSKEGVEQTQNETILKLTAEKRELESENERLKSELEDAVENCKTMKVSVENTSIELLETQNMISAIQREAAEVDRLTKEKSELLNHNESLRKEVTHLRTVVNETQKQFAHKENELKIQITSITAKCHQLEDEISNASSDVADATMPLSMEIEKLQHEIINTKAAADKREKTLHSKIQELDHKLASAQNNETSFNALQKSYEESVSAIERKLESALESNKQLTKELKDAVSKCASLSADFQKELSAKSEELSRVKLVIESLEQDLRNEQIERKKFQVLAEQLRESQTLISNISNNNGTASGFFPQVQSSASMASTASTLQTKPAGAGQGSGENSPSNQSILSEVSYSDEVFDPYNSNAHPMTPKSFFESFSSFSNVESLYGQLRQKDGELYQYQEDAAKNEKIRKTLNEEIAQLTVQNQELQMAMKKYSDMEIRLAEVEKNYNAVLQMYGEKVEEAEELRLDLEDVKQMYKAQIDQLLQR